MVFDHCQCAVRPAGLGRGRNIIIMSVSCLQRGISNMFWNVYSHWLEVLLFGLAIPCMETQPAVRHNYFAYAHWEHLNDRLINTSMNVATRWDHTHKKGDRTLRTLCAGTHGQYSLHRLFESVKTARSALMKSVITGVSPTCNILTVSLSCCWSLYFRVVLNVWMG